MNKNKLYLKITRSFERLNQRFHTPVYNDGVFPGPNMWECLLMDTIFIFGFAGIGFCIGYYLNF